MAIDFDKLERDLKGWNRDDQLPVDKAFRRRVLRAQAADATRVLRWMMWTAYTNMAAMLFSVLAMPWTMSLFWTCYGVAVVAFLVRERAGYLHRRCIREIEDIESSFLIDLVLQKLPGAKVPGSDPVRPS